MEGGANPVIKSGTKRVQKRLKKVPHHLSWSGGAAAAAVKKTDGPNKLFEFGKNRGSLIPLNYLRIEGGGGSDRLRKISSMQCDQNGRLISIWRALKPVATLLLIYVAVLNAWYSSEAPFPVPVLSSK